MRLTLLVSLIVSATSYLFQIPAQAQTPGLVAAYSFNEASGALAADASGNGNAGTISAATWTTSGRFFSALSFNGLYSWMTVNDAPSLRLTTGMTLEAWVNPKVLSGWRPAVQRERPGGASYVL